MFHLTSTGCALVLQKDMEYWGIDELMMEPCCALKYYPEIETCVNEKQVCILVFSVANYYIVVKVNSIGNHVQVKRKVLFTFRKFGVFMLELETLVCCILLLVHDRNGKICFRPNTEYVFTLLLNLIYPQNPHFLPISKKFLGGTI